MGWIPGLSERRRTRTWSYVPPTIEVLELRALLADGISPLPGPQLNGAPGVPLTNVVVATFTVTDPTAGPGTRWNAHIKWGDNAPDTKQVQATPGPNNTFQFLGTHTYAAAGTFTITVMIALPGSHKPNDNIVMTKAVIASPATLTAINVSPANPTVARGTTQQFTATGVFSDNSTQNLTNRVAWASATPTVATISNTGLATALAPGTSTISATLNGVTGSTLLTVNTAALSQIVVTPSNPSIAFGATQQFTATGTFTNNTTRDLTSQVTWTSAAPTIATISNTGLATAVAQGTSVITASLSGVSGSTALTVKPPPPPPFPVVGQKITARVLKTFTQFVAYFSVPNTKTQDVHAVIDWGDGSLPKHGHIHGEGRGRYAVIGSHRYVKTGTFQVTVTIRDPLGRKANVKTIVDVT